MSENYSSETRRLLLKIARESLEYYLQNGKHLNNLPEITELQKKRAVFVTLWTKQPKELRGCIGQIEARDALIKAVAKTVISAAIEDPRFNAVDLIELAELTIEINVLTPMSPIFPDKIEIGRHGLLLRKNDASAVFLPEVPVSQGWNRLTYLDQLCRKAGLPKGSWESADAELFSFESEVWEEE